MSITTPEGPKDGQLVIEKDGNKLAGTIIGTESKYPLQAIVLKNGDIAFKMTVIRDGNEIVCSYTGNVSKDGMKGDVDFGGYATGTWSATPRQASAAKH
jgi:hypothetical protein